MGEEHQRPRLAPPARTEAELRRARQAKALRENLRRRKARDDAPSGEPTSSVPERGNDEP